MAYLKISKTRFEFLLRSGVGDDELRRFFSEKRIPLIQKGGKVQNLPRGFKDRIRTLGSLPPTTYSIIQDWFSTNLTMLDPVSSAELVDMFRMYEEMGESPSESEAKMLSRSCLIHLFSPDPPQELVDFLKSECGSSEMDPKLHSDKEFLPKSPPLAPDRSLLSMGVSIGVPSRVKVFSEVDK